MSKPNDHGFNIGRREPAPFSVDEWLSAINADFVPCFDMFEMDLRILASDPAWTRPAWSILRQKDWLAVLDGDRPEVLFRRASNPAFDAPSSQHRPGQFSAVLTALTRLPEVQALLADVRDEARQQVRLLCLVEALTEKDRRSLSIRFDSPVSESVIEAIVDDHPIRKLVITAIEGKRIPIPGISGLFFNMSASVPSKESGAISASSGFTSRGTGRIPGQPTSETSSSQSPRKRFSDF